MPDAVVFGIIKNKIIAFNRLAGNCCKQLLHNRQRIGGVFYNRIHLTAIAGR